MKKWIALFIIAVGMGGYLYFRYLEKRQAETQRFQKKEVETPSFSNRDQQLPNVVVVSTGGTIAEAIDPATGAAIPSVSGKDLIAAVPGLSKIANIEVVNFSNIDSSQMTPEIWAELSQTVSRILENSEVAGVVVTHGTDTMSEGAYFLDLTVTSEKPVVFVGSMRDTTDLSPDGPANLCNAVTQVCSPEAQNWGVTVSLNQYICSARDVRKTETTNVQTFNSGEKGYLGYIAMGKVRRFNEALHRQKIPLPEVLPNVVIITEYAGSDGSFVRQAVASGVDAIVIQALGAGNVNAKTYEALLEAIDRNIPVVVTSSVFNGAVYPLYGDLGGGEALAQHGAILAGDLPASKARILTMLALPLVQGDREKLRDILNR